MSKKILKRSLVLGALMAFVITGSAMAAELNINYEGGNYTATGTGIENDISVTSQDDLFTSLEVVNWGKKTNTGGTVRYYGDSFANNKVVINNVDFDGDSNDIYGGRTDNTGNADNNYVELNNTKINSVVFGGASWTNGTANYNVVKLNKVYGSASVYGGASANAEARGNKLEIILGDKDLDLKGPKGYESYGGQGLNGDAIENEIVITSDGTGVLTGCLHGGNTNDGTVTKNTVTLNNVTMNISQNSKGKDVGSINGGIISEVKGNAGVVTQNTVIINGGNIEVIRITGGLNYAGEANENLVTINGATVDGEVYGGRGKTEASNNTVNISGEANIENASLFGGFVTSKTGVSEGNTLNIDDGWSGKIKSAQNFNTVNFGKKAYMETNVALGSDATINLADGDDYTSEYAIKGELTVDSANATLSIGNIKETTYNIASVYNDDDTTWALDNDLMQVAKDEDGKEIGWIKDNGLQVKVEAKPVSEIAESLGVSQGTASLVEDIISNDNANAEAVQFVENVMNSGVSKEVAQEAYAAMEKMAEAGGQSATAARIVNNVTGVTNDRLSFNCGHSAPHKGGHGVGLFEEGSGADIWVEYVHGKDKVEDMKSSNGASSYEGQYNGFVMGVDFKKVNKFQSGIAFNYGEGDTNSVGSSARTHSDYDFWGVGYYGNIHNDDSNVIFDINYAKTDSDVTQNSAGGTLEASPETTTLSAGVKVEKLYQNENVQIVPYTGLRFMSIETDDYATKGGGFMYNMERQNIWLLPVGVSIKQEIVNDNGWVVSPRVDLSYIWAFGDTNSNMEVKSGNGISPIWYDVMDDGSFLGLVGIEAHKGQWGYGVAYSYQKGDHSESKKWFIDVNYSF